MQGLSLGTMHSDKEQSSQTGRFCLALTRLRRLAPQYLSGRVLPDQRLCPIAMSFQIPWGKGGPLDAEIKMPSAMIPRTMKDFFIQSNQSGDARWRENTARVQRFPAAGFVLLFCQYLFLKKIKKILAYNQGAAMLVRSLPMKNRKRVTS